jgi:hypothetical protein
LFNGYDTAGFHLGGTYEIGRSLADILLATRFAVREDIPGGATEPPPGDPPAPPRLDD